MAEESIYGVISDFHLGEEFFLMQGERVGEKKDEMSRLVWKLKDAGAQAFILNGDIGDTQVSKNYIGLREIDIDSSRRNIALLIDAAARSSLPVYAQPGNHENYLAYTLAMEELCAKYQNLFDALKPENQKVEMGSHDLVFMPGGTPLVLGGFLIKSNDERLGLNDLIPSTYYSGLYSVRKSSLSRMNVIRMIEPAEAEQEMRQGQVLHYKNIDDLEKLVRQPEKTVVFCHNPQKFESIETGLDVLTYGKATLDFFYDSNGGKALVPTGHQVSGAQAVTLKQEGYPIEIKYANIGNAYLKQFFEKLGLKKAVSGHMHHLAGRACDSAANPVAQGEFVNELFWNASHASGGKAGLLRVRGEEVAYENIQA